MEAAPHPQPGVSGGGNNTNNNATNDWRASVLQSYRNAEVREIASVLASLEPGANRSSKLMLAMRFEDTIFKAASSLADYRKRITKRLKKLREKYEPTTAPTSATPSQTDVEVLLTQLRTKYGKAVKFIVQHADAAIHDVETKSGTERSNQLRSHTDSAVEWAKQLGIWDEAPLSVSAAAARSSEGQLQQLQQHLERRVDNIRTYVVKHADPDLFLQETIEKKDRELKDRANRMLSICLSKLISKLQDKTNATVTATTTTTNQEQQGSTNENNKSNVFDAHKALQEALDKAQATVPPPTRNNSNDIQAAMIQLDKLKASSTALMAYFAIPDRHVTAPRNALEKIMTVVKEGSTFVQNVLDQLPQRSTDHVTLSDAWTKLLELPSEVPSLEPEGGTPTKRLKGLDGQPITTATTTTSGANTTTHSRLYTSTRVLLTPRRKTPSNLLPALRRKRAQLVRPPHGSRGSHLILEFGTAFTMTIYLSPLLVSLRATREPSASHDSTKDITPARDLDGPLMATTTQLSTKGCASWIPLYQGLTNRQDLAVWGVTDSSYESVGRVVEERLRDASMHATHMLRRCFANHVKDKTIEFEVEILEASALLEFLHIARTTYMPNWQDDEELRGSWQLKPFGTMANTCSDLELIII
jgi:hypothetical protein